MNDLKKIIISGQTPSHKNSKQMFVSRSTGKFFPANNNKYSDWKDFAITEIKQSRIKFTGPVALAATFYVGDNRGRDLDNMLASIQDVLVSAGAIIEDDNKNLPFIFAKSGGIDRENPRAEITFFPVQWDEKKLNWNIDESVVKWF